MSALRTTAMMLALATSVAGAQLQAVVDSTIQMNRGGRYADAARFARSEIARTTDLGVRCQLRANMLWSLAKLSMLDVVNSELKPFDAECDLKKMDPGYATDLAQVRAAASMPALPRTGFDLTFFEPFWKVIDTLSAGLHPSDSLWHRLSRTPGYRLADNPELSDLYMIAAMPALRAKRDTMLARKDEGAATLAHIVAAIEQRPALMRLADSIQRNASFAEPLRNASRFLPAGTADHVTPPLVAVGLFRDDGYARDEGIIVDLLNIHDNGLTMLLSHEVHHMLLMPLNRFTPPGDAPDARLLYAILFMRNEGLADQIDKPHPLPGSSPYVRSYNALYDRTPLTIKRIDSLLAAIDSAPDKVAQLGPRIAALLPASGHATGAYIAREIIETFGVDSIMPAVSNPFAFLRTFAAAEAKRGNPPPFSPAALRVLDGLERKYMLR